MSFYENLDIILESFDEKPVVIAGKLVTKYPHSFQMLKYDPKGYTEYIRTQAHAKERGENLPNMPEGYVQITYPGTANSLAEVIGLKGGKPSGVVEPARPKDDYIIMTVKDEVVSAYEKIFKEFGINYSKDFQARYDVGGKGTRNKVVNTQFRLFFAENPAPLIAGDSPTVDKPSKAKKSKPKKATSAADARRRLEALKAQLASKQGKSTL